MSGVCMFRRSSRLTKNSPSIQTNQHVFFFSTSMKPADSHVKPGPQRYKPYNTPTRPNTPRTPKHRLSVDANLQIPEALNSASKKDLLRRVCDAQFLLLPQICERERNVASCCSECGKKTRSPEGNTNTAARFRTT